LLGWKECNCTCQSNCDHPGCDGVPSGCDGVPRPTCDTAPPDHRVNRGEHDVAPVPSTVDPDPPAVKPHNPDPRDGGQQRRHSGSAAGDRVPGVHVPPKKEVQPPPKRKAPPNKLRKPKVPRNKLPDLIPAASPKRSPHVKVLVAKRLSDYIKI
jgi:hypothetical protein